MGKAQARRPTGLTWSSQNQQGGQDPEAGRPQQGGSRGNHHGADGSARSARPAGRPRFYPGRRNAVGPVPQVSGGRSQGGVGLRGGNKPLRGLGGGLPAGPSTWACFRALQEKAWALTLTGGRGRGRPPKLKRDVVPVPVGKGGAGSCRSGSWVWAVGKAPGPRGGGGWRGAARGSLTGPVTQRKTWPSLGLWIPLTHFPKARESGPRSRLSRVHPPVGPVTGQQRTHLTWMSWTPRRGSQLSRWPRWMWLPAEGWGAPHPAPGLPGPPPTLLTGGQRAAG